MSSFMMVGEGYKRSLNVSLDDADPKQRLYGYKTLNLLNSHEDPSFMHTVLYSEIARKYLPAAKANFVKVAINGESWGVYVNAQQFDKTFVQENTKGGAGARWKVPGNPGARGGLEYLGENVADYKTHYEMKAGDDKDWKAFIALCKTLNQTPPAQLEAALKPMLDIDGALRFLALDNALVNGDGYWVRSSDYSIFRDAKGLFHIVPQDMNETFGPGGGFGPPPGFMRGPDNGPGGPGPRDVPNGPGNGPRPDFGPGPDFGPPPGGGPGPNGGPDFRGGPPGGPGGGRGPRGGPVGRGGMRAGSFDLDPLIGLDDPTKPLRSKLLAVPSLKQRYLEHVRALATDSLDWNTLRPVVARYRALIEKEVAADTRKLTSYAEFQKAMSEAEGEETAPQGRPTAMSLRSFALKRRAYLLNRPEIKAVAQAPEQH
jgi:hypothetical protein